MNNQDNMQGQPKGVEMDYVLEEYMNQTVELTKENIFLKAYISQLESKIVKLEGSAKSK